MRRFFCFLLSPMFTNGRWFLWVLLFIVFMMMGNTITAIRMEIPNRDEVFKVSGVFVDTTKLHGTAGYRPIHIVDQNGIKHKCNCEPKDGRCFNPIMAKDIGIFELVDANELENKGLSILIIKRLAGKSGHVWLYPNRSLFGLNSTCYHISDEDYVYLPFEYSVAEYEKLKSGINIYAFWTFWCFWLLILVIYIIVRVNLYIYGEREGESGI